MTAAILIVDDQLELLAFTGAFLAECGYTVSWARNAREAVERLRAVYCATSGYDFGTKFFFAPAAGTRVVFSSRLHLRAEFRANFWRLNYPLSFRQEPDPVIITGRDSEWDLSPWVLFGFGYTL